MSYAWKINQTAPTDFFEAVPEYTRTVAQLLYNRGARDSKSAHDFFDIDYYQQHDSFLFTDMHAAVDSIWNAIILKKKILIYADYDADAVTACSVFVNMFRYLNHEASVYIPDRFTEGYGLNVAAMEKFKAEGIEHIITVDCGTNSVAEAAYAQAHGIEMIITDHHEITGEIPQAHALINPKRSGETYPDTQLTGVGVAYKVARAVLAKKENVISVRNLTPEQYQPGWDKWLLDLVAIGTIADCHSLKGENRILVHYGLLVMQKSKWPGLRLLLENAGVAVDQHPPDAVSVGFSIAPRINAAGRLEHANIAQRLLCTTDYAEAIRLANQIEEINRRRQDLTARITSAAREQAIIYQKDPILLLSGPDWQKGVVGIVAGRIAEEQHKPVLVLEEGPEESTGSGRTGAVFNLVEALIAHESLLIKYGGHQQAVGLTVATKNIPELRIRLNQYAQLHPPELVERVHRIEAVAEAYDMSVEGCRAINTLGPFGAENPQPVLLFQAVKIVQIKAIGANNAHLQMQVQLDEIVTGVIAFQKGHLVQQYAIGDSVNLVGELHSNTWRGVERAQIKLLDIAPSSQNTAELIF